MRDGDEIMEALITGLRTAEPPAGMQGRILQAMEVHASVSASTRWRSLVAPSFALLAVMTAVFIVGMKMHHPFYPPVATTSQFTHVDGRQATRPETTVVKTSKELMPKAPGGSVRRAQGGDRLRQIQARSYPAPPLPLTEQERLLLRLAHRGDAKNSAVLNPDLRAANSLKSAAEFQQFFEIDAKEMRDESE